jgi:hypothetical protein
VEAKRSGGPEPAPAALESHARKARGEGGPGEIFVGSPTRALRQRHMFPRKRTDSLKKVIGDGLLAD